MDLCFEVNKGVMNPIGAKGSWPLYGLMFSIHGNSVVIQVIFNYLNYNITISSCKIFKNDTITLKIPFLNIIFFFYVYIFFFGIFYWFTSPVTTVTKSLFPWLPPKQLQPSKFLHQEHLTFISPFYDIYSIRKQILLLWLENTFRFRIQ